MSASKLSHRDLVERIRASADQSAELLQVMIEYEHQPEIAVATFEAVAGLIKIVHYWTYNLLSRAYFLLGRNDACFMASVAAVQLEPAYPNWHMFENMFRYMRNRGLYIEAADVFRHQVAHTPEMPIAPAYVLNDVIRRGHLDDAGPLQDMSEPNEHLVELEGSSIFSKRIFSRYGIKGPQSSCYAVENLAAETPRPEVQVADLADAEVLVFDGNIIVFDDNRRVLADLSVSEFPEILAAKAQSLADDPSFPTIERAVVSVISDRYATANVCHFLLDQTSRLALYDRKAATGATVIGPSLVTDYQRRIMERLGVHDYHGSAGRFRVRANRLLISRTCKSTFVHPAHLGADWAISYIRRNFGASDAPVTHGTRIYISRSDASHRRVRNEVEVLRMLEAAGFAEVALATLDYDSQVDVFLTATHVVGMHGAGLTGMVFCPAGAKVLEICHPISGTAAYAVVGSALNMDYSILVGRDADSDAPHLNDWTRANAGEGMAGFLVASNRDVTVDLDELRRWLVDSGALRQSLV